uniref:Uncharacterized protein n=1 Tax=Cacopsylla melanoneura TaxID=428564 RepID=A0A8D9E1Q6_9HEMI
MRLYNFEFRVMGLKYGFVNSIPYYIGFSILGRRDKCSDSDPPVAILEFNCFGEFKTIPFCCALSFCFVFILTTHYYHLLLFIYLIVCVFAFLCYIVFIYWYSFKMKVYLF